MTSTQASRTHFGQHLTGRSLLAFTLFAMTGSFQGCGEPSSDDQSEVSSPAIQFRDAGATGRDISADGAESRTPTGGMPEFNTDGSPQGPSMQGTENEPANSSNGASESNDSNPSESGERDAEEDFPVFGSGDQESEPGGAEPDDEMAEPGDENAQNEDESAQDQDIDDEGQNGDREGRDEGDAQDECALRLRAQVRDQDGPCVQCTAGQFITVYGLVENPCDRPLTYRSERSCLVATFTVTRLDSGSESIYESTCRAEAQDIVIPGGSVHTASRPAGRLSAGDFELRVLFQNAERTAPTLEFSVE